MKQIVNKTSPRTILGAGAVIIIFACFMAYIPAIKGGFVWDDNKYVTKNPLLTARDGLYRIWFSTDSPSQYFPLVYTTFRAEYPLWGLNPAGYHAVNVAIHCINALLLWVILRRLSIPGAWLASAIFALHPVQVESVAWITERKNTLMLLFSLLSILYWVKFVFDNQTGRKAVLLYAGSLVFCALSLFSKATACMLPAALVLILWLKNSPITVKRWLQILPYVAMGIGDGLLVMWWERHHQGTGTVNFGLSVTEKVLIAGRALWFYLWKLVWPVNLTFSYPRWNIDATDVWQYAWPAGFAAVMAAGWLLRKRTGRGIPAAIIFFPAMLLPMLGFFSLYTFIYTFVADHYQYMASIGPIAIIAGITATVYRRSGENVKFIIVSAAGVLLITLGVLTWRQCGAYKNSDTLWADTLKKNPDSLLAHGSVGKMLFEKGKYIEAKSHLEQTIKVAPYLKAAIPTKYAAMHFDMAADLEALGRLDDAAVYYQKSLDVWEHFALAHYQLALVLAKQGNVEQARLHFLRALEITREGKNDKFNEVICRQLNLLEEKNN
jgi:protein O-mannosyl-transferase